MRHLKFLGRVFVALVGVLFVAAAIYMLVSANLAFADIGGVIGFFTPIIGTGGFGFCLVYFSLPKEEDSSCERHLPVLRMATRTAQANDIAMPRPYERLEQG